MDRICADLNDSTDDGFSVRFMPDSKTMSPAQVTETFPVVRNPSDNSNEDTTDLENLIIASCSIHEELFEEFHDEHSALGKTEEETEKEYAIYLAKRIEEKTGVKTNPVMYKEDKVAEVPNVISKQSTKNYLNDFQQLIRVGSRYGYHFLVCVSNLQALKTMGLNINLFNHRLAFKTDSTDTSAAIFNNNTSAYRLPEHTCYYGAYGTNSGNYSITPYLHPGITWNNWIVDENGIGCDGSRL